METQKLESINGLIPIWRRPYYRCDDCEVEEPPCYQVAFKLPSQETITILLSEGDLLWQRQGWEALRGMVLLERLKSTSCPKGDHEWWRWRFKTKEEMPAKVYQSAPTCLEGHGGSAEYIVRCAHFAGRSVTLYYLSTYNGPTIYYQGHQGESTELHEAPNEQDCFRALVERMERDDPPRNHICHLWVADPQGGGQGIGRCGPDCWAGTCELKGYHGQVGGGVLPTSRAGWWRRLLGR